MPSYIKWILAAFVVVVAVLLAIAGIFMALDHRSSTASAKSKEKAAAPIAKHFSYQFNIDGADAKGNIGAWNVSDKQDPIEGRKITMVQMGKDLDSPNGQASFYGIIIRKTGKHDPEVFFSPRFDLKGMSANLDFPVIFKFDDNEPVKTSFTAGSAGSFFIPTEDQNVFLSLCIASKKMLMRFVRKDSDVTIDLVFDMSDLRSIINFKGI